MPSATWTSRWPVLPSSSPPCSSTPKLDGIPADILAAALQQAKEARATILEVINECIDGPAEMSEFAPRIITTSVPG